MMLEQGFEGLVFSGGGIHGFAMLGAVKEMQTIGVLRDVRVVVGTSAGALVGAVCVMGVDAREVLEKVLRRPLLSHFKLDFDGLISSGGFGLDDGAGLSQLIDEVLGQQVTFRQLKEATGKSLVVVATSLATRRAVYMDADSHPNMLINTAIRMSCSVPVLFDCVKHEGDVYVDGGLTEHFALACPQVKDLRVLGVSVTSEQACEKFDTFSQYLGALCGMLTMNKESSPGACAQLSIDINKVGRSSMDVTVDSRTLEMLFAEGEKAAAQRFV